jgi:hypothetical protein
MYILSMHVGLQKSKNRLKRISASIKKDAIHPAAYNRYKLPYSCEDCSHFKASNETCTLGMPTENHLYRNQIFSYNLSGKVALCRLQEID